MNYSKASLFSRTRDLMDRHNLQYWDIRIGNARTTAGLCNYSKKQITISLFLANARDKNHTEDTILHEIAHALAGHEAGHGQEWKDICRQIGARPERCFSVSEIPPEKRYKWIAQCPAHPETYYQMNRRLHGYRCSHCLSPLHYAEYAQPEPRTFKPFKTTTATTLERLQTSIEEHGADFSDGVLLAPMGYRWASTDTHYLDTGSDYYLRNDSGKDRTPNTIYKMLVDDMSDGTYKCDCQDCVE